MISLILLKLFTFSQILQGVPKLSHATVLQIIVFNDDIKVRQGKVDTGTPGVTSWPEDMELNRQDLNTHGNKHIITNAHLDTN